MDRSVLMILAIVIVVGAVGFLTIMPEREIAGDLATGNVVQEAGPADACGQCRGTPVCAAKFGRVSNYENACVAQCEGARVIYDGVCERIPRVGGR